MKKILIIIAIVLPLIYLASCTEDPVQPTDEQVLQFVSKTDSVEAISGLMESRVEIKNISNKQVNIQVRLEIVSLAPGHKALVCMGDMCYAGVSEDKTYPGTIVLAPNATTTKTDFFAELNPSGEPGTSIIRYIFTPDGDTTKAISYTTKYKVVSGL
jgi:hypothetical protein